MNTTTIFVCPFHSTQRQVLLSRGKAYCFACIVDVLIPLGLTPIQATEETPKARIITPGIPRSR